MTFKTATRAALATLLMTASAQAFAQDTAPSADSPARSTEPAAPVAEDASPITISGTAALVSDYRFRGVSQSDEELSVQGSATVAHESGLYAGFWASNLAGWGTFGGANLELDLIAGSKFKPAENATVDVGVTYYLYPGGADETDFFEPYIKISGTQGPLTLTAGVAYAPKQQALGRWYFTGADAAAGVYNDPGDTEDNLYLSGDGALAIAGTPLTVKAHIGYSDGNRGLGPNATSVAPTGKYWDYALGVDATYKNLTLNVSYVDTDISRRESAYLQPSFSRGQDGTGSIADGTFVVALTAAF
ncbi:MAG TPA: TorF family putative porin [Sphingomonas sp.]|jgi:uncharacterized protein (TIGR02001 family)